MAPNSSGKSSFAILVLIVTLSAGAGLALDNPPPVPAFSPETDLSRTLGSPDKRWYGVYSQYLANDQARVDIDSIAKVVGNHDAVMADIAAKAPLDSPLFMGDPTAPTPDPGDDTNSVATTAFVQRHAAGLVATGDSRLSDARTPVAHAASHAQDGSDPVPLPVAGDTVLGITRGDGVTVKNNPDGSLSTIQGEYEGMPPAPSDGKAYAGAGATWIEIDASEGLEEALDGKADTEHTHSANDVDSGILPMERGGTGNADGLAASAIKLETARTILTDLASAASGSFDGSADVAAGVSGVLPIVNGGTGADTAAAALTALGVDYTFSKAENGYYKFPGGLILQWGTVTPTGGDVLMTITFPMAFTTTCFGVFLQRMNTGTTIQSAMPLRSTSETNFTAIFNNGGSGVGKWLAIGY